MIVSLENDCSRTNLKIQKKAANAAFFMRSKITADVYVHRAVGMESKFLVRQRQV